MSSGKLQLIDASAWIEVMRGTASDTLKKQVTLSLESGAAAMSEPVWLELSRGIKGKKESERLQSLRQLCAWLPFTDACWERAHLIAGKCTRSGVNVPLGDILVAACARTHSVELIEHDRHFAMIDRAMR
jgi:predicted nucleic acid-binding protein